MPGVRLNDTERRLAEWWSNGAGNSPTLRAITIEGDPGLRGIRELAVAFEYPLAVLCGRNGNGKTTLLALAALAFGGFAGHRPVGALRKPLRGEDFTYYTFRDFFFRGPGDVNVAGVTIRWSYSGDLVRKDGRAAVTPIEVTKRSDKWMHYERRPSKPVQYVGVARSIPAAEQRVLRSHFGFGTRARRSSLTEPFRQRLNEIMGRQYEDAEVLSSSRYAVRSASAGGSAYTSFNMGAGEDILIELLHVLQETPEGSLIVIEEIELGLHPEALTKLARHLQEVMWEKRLQMIVSTHSRDFLDAVPRQARIMIQRHGDVHTAIQGPTARFAGGVMGGHSDPEAHIYCEDGVAEHVIGAALTAETRRRTKVVPVGSKSELASLALFHQRSGIGELQALVWDGDVSAEDIQTAVRESVRRGPRGLDPGRLSWTCLPGGQGPERWLVDTLRTPAGRRGLADELRIEEHEAEGLLEELAALGDAHDILYEMETKMRLRPDEALSKLVAAVQKLDGDPLGRLREFVEGILSGRVMHDPDVDAGD